jgi:ProP effector
MVLLLNMPSFSVLIVQLACVYPCSIKVMGFEQLAALRDQLAQQAKVEKAEKTAQRVVKAKKTRAEPSTERKVDPIVQIIGQLQKQFPLAFPKKPAAKVPLKIGIHKDLLEHTVQLAIDEKTLRAAIKTWCWGQRYWVCMTEGAVRVDLQGQAAGEVAKTDAERAVRLLAGRKPKAKAGANVAAEQADAAPAGDESI